MTMNFETLTLTLDAGVATLTLNRPDARNALNSQMCHELLAAATALSANPDAKVVLIRGAGSAFCAGADLKERKTMSVEETTARRVKGFNAYAAIERMPQAVIAVVHGAAFGSGCEIASSADFILASEKATFCYPEVGWGTVGATQRLPRIAGTRMAKELLFTSRVFAASEAREIGLVNQIYGSSEELVERATEMAQKIAAAPPLALRLTKRCIDQGVETTRDGAMAIELLAIEENLRKSNWKDVIAGFGSGTKKEGTGNDA